MPKQSETSGFTIVELMVTMAVAAILIGVALPAFNEFISQRTMTSRVNDFVLAVSYARSEAVRRGSVVSVLAIDPQANDEWSGGYCVVVDPDDCSDADSVLRTFGPMDDVTVHGTGGLDGVTRLRFNGRGMLVNAVAGRVRLCSTDAGVDPGRAIDLSATGRADAEELDCDA